MHASADSLAAEKNVQRAIYVCARSDKKIRALFSQNSEHPHSILPLMNFRTLQLIKSDLSPVPACCRQLRRQACCTRTCSYALEIASLTPEHASVVWRIYARLSAAGSCRRLRRCSPVLPAHAKEPHTNALRDSNQPLQQSSNRDRDERAAPLHFQFGLFRRSRGKRSVAHNHNICLRFHGCTAA